MNRLITFFCLVSLVAMISCNIGKQSEIEEVVLNSFDNNNFWKSDSLKLSKNKVNDSEMYYYYYVGNDTQWFSFVKPINSDSSISIDKQFISLISEKTFNINGEPQRVLKYYYDDLESYDEETSFFYHQDYGFLVIFNDGWLLLQHTFEYDSLSKLIIEKILLDKTGFYRMAPPPLPPPPTKTVDCFSLPNEQTNNLTLLGLVNSDSENSALNVLISKLIEDSLEVETDYGYTFNHKFLSCDSNAILDLTKIKVNRLYAKQTINENVHPDFTLFELSFESIEHASKAKELIELIIGEHNIFNEKPPQFVAVKKNKVIYLRTRAYGFIDLVEKYKGVIENNH
jgi:hypothetical protein